MDLHTAGHRGGVVCAPHQAAVEAGRAALAEGGNAIEAMVAMAATIAVVYPHMNGIGGDGFWLIREPSGKVRALMAAGVAGEKARRELYRELRPRRDPVARAARRADRSGSGRGLDAGARSRQGAGRPAAARRSARRRDPPRRARARDGAQPRPAAPPRRSPSSRSCRALPRRSSPTASRQPQGTIFKQPALAATLDQLAQAGPRRLLSRRCRRARSRPISIASAAR